ncbi:MAG TPA: mechanosensitive ion channel family protein [Stellaceae bacterium]|nr:mechanosensitive ion channel family protein [Stellaceae bacterium]
MKTGLRGWWRCVVLGVLAIPFLTPAGHGAPAPGVATAVQSVSDDVMSGAGWLGDSAKGLTDALKPIFASIVDLPEQFAKVLESISGSSVNSLGFWALEIVGTIALALAALRLAPLPLARWRRAQLAVSADGSRLPALIAAFASELVGVLALLVVVYLSHAAWFGADTVATRTAEPFVSALAYWRLILLPIDLVLRHGEAKLRLIEVSDLMARQLRDAASTLVALELFSTALLRMLYRGGMAAPDVQFIALCIGILNAGVAFFLIRRVRRAVAGEAVAETGEGSRAAHTVFERAGHPLAILFVSLALLAWLLGVTFKNLRPFWGLIDTAGIVIGVWVLDMMVGAWLDHMAVASKDQDEADRRAQWHRVIRHCVGAGLWLAAVAVLVEIWIVDLSQMLPADDWRRYRGSVWSAVVTLYIAYALCRIVFMHTERHIRPAIQAVPSNEPAPIASRLQTVLPLMRVFILITIALLAGLIALSNLGVNTTSLIAGASIFGLAISFGSQSLVRDIVSGIFFMADDAFRIGEYIDTGKLKGTVEGMSIRSLRLRHQNGQIHVIPFGQIQHVTNFSRDWTTVKFNLRLSHETDVEQLRKTVKQIGVEMMSDPELGPEFIAPLKLQGVADIDPNALVVRLKFTARPVQPTFVYRAALKRIHKAFREKGIEFSNPTVFVQARQSAGVPEEESAQLVSMGAAATGQSLPKSESG